MKNPIIKLIISINIFLLSIYGSIEAVIIAILLCIIAIIISKNKNELVFVSPRYIIIMFIAIILLSLPDGEREIFKRVYILEYDYL